VKKHTRIYLDGFQYDETDFIPCEISGGQAVDIHHIEARGAGGDPYSDKDRIENLMAITRELHIRYGDVPSKKAELFEIHRDRMLEAGVEFDEDYIEEKIKYYKVMHNNHIYWN
tara:strand:+ start:743 stop:1084 length:342 start_codon:yes stop_codon:yes gene_type:complete